MALGVAWTWYVQFYAILKIKFHNIVECELFFNKFLGSSVDLYSKKKVFDEVMMMRRLHEEESILLMEIKQHCESLRADLQALKGLATQLCLDLGDESK